MKLDDPVTPVDTGGDPVTDGTYRASVDGCTDDGTVVRIVLWEQDDDRINGWQETGRCEVTTDELPEGVGCTPDVSVEVDVEGGEVAAVRRLD